MQRITSLDFEFACNEILIKFDTRIDAHAQLLQSGAAFFAASDSVTHSDWANFIENEKISRNFPGIQGMGYSAVIPRNKLAEHIESIRKSGFPDYNVRPAGGREFYTSIIYLEPFTGRNLRAFGYDMFSEPVRRKAMELSRDSDYAALSGKVLLVQETNMDVQAGALMYVPVYRKQSRINTIEERRAAIIGWVYSPYRMDDLMNGIMGNRDLSNENRIRLQIYDSEIISKEALLYDSQRKDSIDKNIKPNLNLDLPIQFNGTKWTLSFSSVNRYASLLNGNQLIVYIAGLIISFLLFFLSLAIVNLNIHTRQIENLNTELEGFNTDKDRFISILGHDLKGPFNSILGFLEILKDDIYKIDKILIKDHIDRIYGASKQTFNLLEDLLLWARAHSGKISYQPQLLKMEDIYNYIIEILGPGAEAKYVRISFSGDPEMKVFADPDMLKAILRNLVSNAIKFSYPGGEIMVIASSNSELATLTVKDNGVGVTSGNLHRLFDISKVFTTRGTSDEKGSGLGLITCKEFVEKHGGKIWVESVEGRGSSFIFSLPYKSC